MIVLWVFSLLVQRKRRLKVFTWVLNTQHLVRLTQSKMNQYSTRNSESYWSHPFRTNENIFSILFQGPKIRNLLQIEIKAASSFYTFKCLIKTFLTNKQNNWTMLVFAILTHIVKVLFTCITLRLSILPMKRPWSSYNLYYSFLTISTILPVSTLQYPIKPF